MALDLGRGLWELEDPMSKFGRTPERRPRDHPRTPHTLYKGKKIVPKDLPSLKIHARPLRNSLAAEEAAGGPRARARCVILVSMHDMTLSHRPAIGARQPCLLMIYARARACSDDVEFAGAPDFKPSISYLVKLPLVRRT